jgi:uncharacterized protein involved in outer membrane biogenesis
MQFVKQPVERKLSEALGVPVTIERLNLSPLSGSLEVSTVVVGTLATVRRVRATVSVGALLRKELVIKSLVIEGPVITIARQPNGSLNVPQRPAKPSTTTEEPAEGDASSKWSLAAEKVQLLDGAVHFRDGAYHLSAERVVGELAQKADGVHVTALAASVGRRDEALDLGEARAHGVLGGVDSIAKIMSASLDATFEIAELIKGSVKSQLLASRAFEVKVSGAVVLSMLRKLLPGKLLPDVNIEGHVQLMVDASMSAQDGLRVKQFTLRGEDLRQRASVVA